MNPREVADGFEMVDVPPHRYDGGERLQPLPTGCAAFDERLVRRRKRHIVRAHGDEGVPVPGQARVDPRLDQRGEGGYVRTGDRLRSGDRHGGLHEMAGIVRRYANGRRRRPLTVGREGAEGKTCRSRPRSIEVAFPSITLHSPLDRDREAMSGFASRCTIAILAAATVAASSATAQISDREYVARRDSLAARVGDGVVVAFGGRTPVSDFGPFYQLPAFHYLTGFDEPDAAMVLVAKGGKATTTLFLTPIAPRTAFYYGRRPDSVSVERTLGVKARSFASIHAFVDSLANDRAAPKSLYHLGDFAAADFARQDSLTRGNAFMRAFAVRHLNDGVTLKDAHQIVDELRARKSPAELALIRKASEISAEGHRAVMLAPEPSHEYEI